jgi:hypothetical protein
VKEANFSTRQEYWKTLIEEQKSSGLSQAQFCKERGLSKSSFYNWSSILKRGGNKRRRNFVPVVAASPSPRPEPMKVVFQSGVALHFAELPDPEWIVELMRLVA